MTDISQLPDAFLFDLDGVLTPTLDVHKRAWKTLFDAVLPPTVTPYTEDDYNQSADDLANLVTVAREEVRR